MRLVGFMHFLQDQANEFFEKTLPESGITYEPNGRHKAYANIADNFRHFWVMVDDEQKIVGTVAVTDLIYDSKYADILHRNSGELCCLYLSDEYKGQGLGEKMLSFAIDQAKSFGYGWLYLDTVTAKSQAGFDLYKKYGFEEIPRYNDNPYSNVCMRLKLW